MRTEQRERVLLGTLGALLGSLLGGACVVLEHQASGAFSLIGGVILAACTVWGYKRLAGRLSRRGAVICLVLMSAAVGGANQINCVIQVLETVESMQAAGLPGAYGPLEELPEVLAIREWYQGRLLTLYLYTLGGALLVFLRERRRAAAAARAGQAAAQAARSAGADPDDPEEYDPDSDSDSDPDSGPEHPELQGTFYPFRKAWMTPLRLSVGVPVLLLLAGLLTGLLMIPNLEARFQTALGPGMVLGAFLSLIPLGWVTLRVTRQCNSFQILYVRAAGRLWRINLMKLCRVGDWEALTPARQAVLRDDILWELENLLKGEDLSFYSPGAITELRNPQAEGEDRWTWTVSYDTEAGGRKKLRIPKGYPELTPAPGMEPAQGPVPCRWLTSLGALVLAAALLGGSVALDQWRLSRGLGPVQRQTVYAVQGAEVLPEIPVREPETYTEYELSEIAFRIDKAFQYGQRQFLDGKTGARYRVYTQYGVDEADVWDTLTGRLDPRDPGYDRFETVCSGEEPLVSLGEGRRYNIVSVHFKDGRIRHTAAVLSDTGACFTIEAEHREADQSAEEVLGNLLYTLKSVSFLGPEVTEENYQAQFHLSEIRDCAYMAAAYLRTDLFGHEAFADVFVPFCESPIYAADGRAVRTEAHGLRVHASIVPGENAKAVIEKRREELAAGGRVYEEVPEDQSYREDLDAACMLTVYEEQGEKRYAVLYAESKWEGFYILREITALPEAIDEEYLPLLKELETVCGLTSPVLEQLGE